MLLTKLFLDIFFQRNFLFVFLFLCYSKIFPPTCCYFSRNFGWKFCLKSFISASQCYTSLSLMFFSFKFSCLTNYKITTTFYKTLINGFCPRLITSTFTWCFFKRTLVARPWSKETIFFSVSRWPFSFHWHFFFVKPSRSTKNTSSSKTGLFFLLCLALSSLNILDPMDLSKSKLNNFESPIFFTTELTKQPRFNWKQSRFNWKQSLFNWKQSRFNWVLSLVKVFPFSYTYVCLINENILEVGEI